MERLASAQLPTKYGTFQVHTFRSRVDGQDHIALTMGDVEGARDVLVRVHRCGLHLAAQPLSAVSRTSRLQLWRDGEPQAQRGLPTQRTGPHPVAPQAPPRAPLLRACSENILGDVFASARDDGCDQLAAAMERIATEGRGVLVYLRGHEGRGIGLAKHVEALVLQQEGQEDAVSANARLGLPADARR